MPEKDSADKTIVAGDGVYLTDTGPEMKVESIKGDDCNCVWIDKDSKVHRATFKIHVLFKVS